MYKTRQKGAVLIVSLIMLVVMTFIGLAGMEITGLEEKMAGNMRDRNMAFQAAEATLLEAEEFLEAQAALPAFDDTNGMYTLLTNGKKRWEEVDWSKNAEIRQYAGKGFSDLAGGAAYIIEEFDTSSSDDDLDPTKASGDDEMFYRITARSVGQTSAAEVMLQTIYKK